MSADEQQAIEDGEQPGYFGGLTGAEARARRTEKEQQEHTLAKLDPNGRIVEALTARAIKGEASAVRELRELGVLQRQEHRTPDQRLLALLSPGQRLSVAAALRGEKVSEADAIKAWA